MSGRCSGSLEIAPTWDRRYSRRTTLPWVHLEDVRLRLDEERCTGHGRCYSLVPSLFDSDDRGHCVVIADDVSGDLVREARTAVDNCPEDALSLETA